MSLRNLDRLLNPRSVAVVGASNKPASVGLTIFQNLLQGAAHRTIFPVNLRHSEVQGHPAVARVSHLPEKPDLVVVCTPAATVPAIVDECGHLKVPAMLILSAGFAESGAAGEQAQAELLAAARRWPEVRILGPNCLGLLVPGSSLNASFAATPASPGHVAFLSQSGALCTAILDWAAERKIGFSHFISVGNMLDVDFADLIDFLAQDPKTRSVLLYVESIPNARAFLSAARACTRTMPIVVCKAGRTQGGGQAILSHTGRMAGDDVVFNAAMARAGVVRAETIDDLFDCAEFLSHSRLPSGRHLAVLTNAGGPGILAVDALLGRGGELAQLSSDTLSRLNEILPPHWSRANPVDILGDASPERYRQSLEAVLADRGVNAVLVLLTPQSMTEPTEVARVVASLARTSRKPVLACWMGGQQVRTGRQILSEEGLPAYETPEHAVRAFLAMTSYRERQTLLYETPRALVNPSPERIDGQRRTAAREAAKASQPILSTDVCQALLQAYGIPTVRMLTARSEEEAVALSKEFDGPVVMKVLSSAVSHKTDVDGVRLNLKGSEEVRTAYESIRQSLASHRPDAIMEGVLLQPMLAAGGLELIIGTRRDATFGSVVMIGAGGTTAECLHDVAIDLPPLNERLARRMLESLRIAPLLKGYRGRPGVDLDRLSELLIRFSWLVAEVPELAEFEINPLRVQGADFVALDVRGRQVPVSASRPYSHLAIRPWPEEVTGTCSLRDGTPVMLRVIRPEDEPEWHALLSVCSPDTIRSRFGSLFPNMTHEAATRYCYPDYDRELSIVAEISDGARGKLIGVAQLVADPDRRRAEFGILVGDPWQEQGIGLALTRFCLDASRSWGLQTVEAITELTNFRMIHAFQELGFQRVAERPGEPLQFVRQVPSESSAAKPD